MLTSKSLTQLTVTDNVLGRIQSNVAAVLNPVLQTPIVDGVLLQRKTIPASGKLTASHGLGRQALGAIVVLSSAAVAVPYVLPADQTAPNGAIVLTFASGAGATINLWVF